jgi:hypothetical protein
MRISAAQRVRVSAFGAAGVEQKIVKVPENEVTLRASQAIVAGRVDLEKDLATDQQREKLNPRKSVLPAEPFDLPGCSQVGNRGYNRRIANPEQRAGARRFQHHVVAAPSHVGEPRQDENVGIAELWRCRPVVGNLRFDDDLVLVASCGPEAVLQQTVPGQSPDQYVDLPVDAPAARRQRGERQTSAQSPRAIRDLRAERSHPD